MPTSRPQRTVSCLSSDAGNVTSLINILSQLYNGWNNSLLAIYMHLWELYAKCQCFILMYDPLSHNSIWLCPWLLTGGTVFRAAERRVCLPGCNPQFSLNKILFLLNLINNWIFINKPTKIDKQIQMSSRIKTKAQK